MAVVGARVSVATTATRLDTSTAGGMGSSSLLVKNKGANSIYLGGSGVTTATGYELGTGDSISVDLKASDAGLYGIVAAATETAHVLQIGA